MAAQVDYVNRVDNMYEFLRQLLQVGVLISAEYDTRGSIYLPGIGKTYQVLYAPYPLVYGAMVSDPSVADFDKLVTREFVLCDFCFYEDGRKSKEKLLIFMAKKFGKGYVEAYKKSEEARIEKELEEQRGVLNQEYNLLLNISSSS